MKKLILRCFQKNQNNLKIIRKIYKLLKIASNWLIKNNLNKQGKLYKIILKIIFQIYKILIIIIFHKIIFVQHLEVLMENLHNFLIIIVRTII